MRLVALMALTRILIPSSQGASLRASLTLKKVNATACLSVRNLLISDSLVLETLEALDGDVLHESVHLLGGAFLLVSDSAHPDTDTNGDVSDTLGPQELVELGVEANILSLHDLGDELLDLLDGGRGALLEANLMSHLGNVNGIVTSHGLQTLLGGLSLRHLRLAIDYSAIRNFRPAIPA